MTLKVKSSSKPALDEMNALLALFNHKRLAEAESLALGMIGQYPKHGFAWKVLGAIYQANNVIHEASVAFEKAAAFLPDDHEVQYNLANCYYDQNDLDNAIVHYRKAIKLNPDFAQAYYNLGNAFKKQDLLQNAEASYKKALAIETGNVWIYTNLAHVLYEQDRFQEAKDFYEQALKIQEDFSSAHVGLGVVLRALDFLTEAEDHFRRAIKLDNDIEAYGHLGNLLEANYKVSEAEACFKDAILAHPDSADAHVKMAIFLRALGRVPESIPYFNQALLIDPSRKDIHVDIGLAKAELGYFLEAESCYREAIKLDADYWLAYNNLGLVLHRMERYAEAELAFNKSIELHPSEALLHSNLGLTLAALGQIKKAETSLKKAVEIHPEYVNAHINLCTNYIAQGRLDEAESECFEALKYDPGSNKAKSNLLFAMNYSGHHSAEYRFQQAREFDQIVTKKVEHAFTVWQSSPEAKRLRIGVMSGDLRQHPVAYFLENWVKNVDFSKFELFAYLTDTREDIFTGRIKPNFSHWKSLVGMTDQAAAESIHDDGIDILFDLSGHTSGNRLQILAWKPAPIQVSWLGYFATTGMQSIDYFIADEVGVPEADRKYFVEKIKYIPDTRLCFTAPHVAIEPSSLPASTSGSITFASFQTLAKAGDDVLMLWAEVMRALPDSKLRWQCKSFWDADVTADVAARFAKLGISGDRLMLLGSVSRDAYFAAHHDVDVILDTFPYPGGTTTCEALWMGVPTLTLAGDSLIARQGASMLSAAGLADWVAETKDEYLNMALSHCSDLNQLAHLRAKLRTQVLASPLFDAERFASNMETAIWEMWYEYYPAVATEKTAHINEVQYQALTKEAYDEQERICQGHYVRIVSATRYSEQDFWNKSALGLSLPRHLKQDGCILANIAFNNTLGLSDVFNQVIEQADDNAILVFVHDDVWLDEANFVDTLIAGLKHYDVIGVAGNKRRLPNQPAWLFVDTALHWDDPEYLSGTVSHGLYAFGEDKFYGEAPAACELLDGVFIATRKSVLNEANVRFDSQFDFHLYDVDFCRSAREAGLNLGAWPIKLTHQSKGAFGSPHWAQKCQLYFNKWESNTPQQQALHDAMREVMQMAHQHEMEGQLVQAATLYQEVLKIQPDNAKANYRLGVVAFNLHGVNEALPHLEKAVQCTPEEEQYWVTYIDALMQSADVATVLEALELGQKFGLKAETAQTLAAEFLERVETQKNESKAQPVAINPLCSNEVITQCLAEMLNVNLFEINAAQLKNTISPHLDMSAFESVITALQSTQQQNEILTLIYKTISAIKLQKEFVGTKVFTPYFDSVLEAIDLQISDVIPRDLKLANVVIASEIYDYGGHTKVIQEILESVENPILIITDVYDRFAKNHLFEKVSSSFIKCPVLILPNEAYLDKTQRLAALINSCAKNVFIVSHHEDAVAIAACSKALDTKYYFVHHADHNPALGNTVSHFNHIDLFEPMAKLCAQDLNKPVTLLPTSSNDLGEKKFVYPIQGFSTVTAGSAGKFSMTGEICLSQIVTESLKTCGGKHYHYGDLSAENVQLIRDALQAASLDPALFVYMGNVPSLWQSLLALDAHIFLGSAPTPGGKSNLEASGAAYPLLVYVPTGAPRYLYVGAEAQIGLTWASIAELTSGLRAVMANHKEFSQQSRQFYLSNCSGEAFKEKLTQLCDAL